MEWKPFNLHAAPLHVRHADLKRFSADSDYRSLCPKCETGILLVNRDQATFRLIRYDRCTQCAQTFIYEDEGAGGEAFEPLHPEVLARLQAAMN